MCDGCVTSFTTYFGTGITGMWITWGNTAASSDATPVATDTTLQVDFDLRLYGVTNLNTKSDGIIYTNVLL